MKNKNLSPAVSNRRAMWWGALILFIFVGLVFLLVRLSSSSLSVDDAKTKTEESDAIIYPVARVDNHMITSQDLLIRLKIYFLETSQNETPELLVEKRDEVLQKLIEERLQTAFADQLNIPDATEQAQAQWQNIVAQNQIPDVKKLLGDRGLTEEDMINFIHGNLRWQSALFGVINQGMNADEKDINKIVEQKRNLMGKTVYNVVEFIVPNPTNDNMKTLGDLLRQNSPDSQAALEKLQQTGAVIINAGKSLTLQKFDGVIQEQIKSMGDQIQSGAILGPSFLDNGKRGVFYILLNGNTMPVMDEVDLRISAITDIKTEAVAPVEQQVRERLWQEAVITIYDKK